MGEVRGSRTWDGTCPGGVDVAACTTAGRVQPRPALHTRPLTDRPRS